MLLSGEVHEGDALVVDAGGGGLVIRVEEPAPSS
jgi:hypothetical protein